MFKFERRKNMFKKGLLEKEMLTIHHPAGIRSPHIMNFDEDEAMNHVKEESEKWIWVEGYKGTDPEMKCRDFQFELGEEYTEKGKIEE